MAGDWEQDKIFAQPLLPQVRMIWYFIVTLAIAVGLALTQWAGRGRALLEAAAFTLLFVAVFGLLSVMTFLIAFFTGALQKATTPRVDKPESPFIDGRLPDQVIPPGTSHSV